jgi:transcriptional regulator with XRE-family HTH domain
MQVGEQIRRLRSLRKISLTDLSKTSGVQIATLSRIENGKMTGTLESHIAIAKAIGIDITELYQALQQDEPVASPESTAEPVAASDGKSSQEILARQVTSKRMLPALIKIEPKGATPTEKLPPASERFLYVLDGAIDVKLKSQTIRLAAKTSLYFNAAQPHSIENAGDKTAKVLSLTTPVVL